MTVKVSDAAVPVQQNAVTMTGMPSILASDDLLDGLDDLLLDDTTEDQTTSASAPEPAAVAANEDDEEFL